ncbi:MAG: Uma2 family endonuclease [Kofleriaceae bacterium]|nr:Uma2 family endonuclease [Kofleriaceae bacterium]
MEMTRTKIPLSEYEPSADTVLLMYGVSWDEFETLLAIRGERSRPKVAYLDGTLELMSTSQTHEQIKSTIGRLVEAYCLEVDMPFAVYGSWLLEKRRKKAGAMPDECYIFDEHPKRKPVLDLVIEVVWTSGGLDKLEIYRRMEVGEVWFWRKGKISVHMLGANGYTTRERSVCLPRLDLELITKLALVEPTSAAIKKLRAAVRS